MNNYFMKIQYDGTAYRGFQRLGNDEKTIQDTLEKCISKAVWEETRITGMSRTDAGVHALCQCINFKIKAKINNCEDFRSVVNDLLPEDIRVLEVVEKENTFHARHDVKSKTYCYRMHYGEVKEVFMRKYVYEIGDKPEVNKMREAAELFVGTHNFRAFSSVKDVNKDTVRTIESVDVEEKTGFVNVYIKGDGFLYNMIRIICGTLLCVGQGKMKLEEVRQAFEVSDRSYSGPTLPAKALILWDAEY